MPGSVLIFREFSPLWQSQAFSWRCSATGMEWDDDDGVEVEEEESDQGQPGAAAAAVRQAEAEGLTLQPSDNVTGYRGAFKDSRPGQAKPFYARVWRADKLVHLG